MLKKFLCILLCFSIAFTIYGSISSFAVFADNDDVNVSDEEKTEEEDIVFEEEKTGEIDASDDALYNGNNDDAEIVEAEDVYNALFPDIKDDETMRYAEVLSAMGFISGYDDGTFKPENEISRVDFMSVLIKSLNLTPENASVSGYNFYDVAEGSWEYNVMSFAVKQNLYSVYNDNTVRPDAPITYMDAAVAYLRAMGYAASAEANGGYIYGYATIANQLALDTGVEIKRNLTRGDAVRLIYNCLNAPINKVVRYGTFVQYSNDTKENILSYYHNVYRSEGIVTATNVSALGDYIQLNSGYISIDTETYACENKQYSVLLGYNVDFYYRHAETENEIVIIQKHKNVEEITIKGEDVISYQNGKLKYLEDDKERVIKIEFDHTFIKNNRYCTDYSSKDFKPSPGYITVIANDGQKYDVVHSYEYFNGVVKSVTALVGVMTISFDYGLKPIELDVKDKNLFIELYTDGNRMDAEVKYEEYRDGDGNLQERTILPKIPVGSLVSVFADEFEKDSSGKNISVSEDARYMKIVINTPSVTGTIKTYDEVDDILQIGNVEYYISKNNFMDSANTVLEIGAKGKFLLDYNGRIAAWIPAIGTYTYSYGYLINAGEGRGLSNNALAKILTSDGDIVTFTMDRNTKINDVRAGSTDKILEKLTASAKFVDSDAVALSQMVKYYSADGEYISKLMTVTASTGVADGYDEKSQISRYAAKASVYCLSTAGYIFTKDTPIYLDEWKENTATGEVSQDFAGTTSKVIPFAAGEPDVLFVVPSTPTFDDDDYYVKKDGWDYGTETSMTSEMYDVDEYLKPSVLVVYADGKTSKTFQYPMFVIEKISQIINDDGAETSRITGYERGSRTSFDVEEESVVRGFKEGDIVMLKGTNKIVKEMIKISSAEEIANYDFDDETVTVKTHAPVMTLGTTRLNTTILESYYTDVANKIMLLQCGPDDDLDGRRTYVRPSYWPNDQYTMHHSGVKIDYYKDTGKIKISAATLSDIKGAKEYGHNSSSKIMIGEHEYCKLRYCVVVNTH